ncbi:phosphonopyruvate decarboxylase [Candidatus Auribacterota bacterium]
MLNCAALHDLLIKRGIDFFTGVPDSVLKDFLGYLSEHAGSSYVTAANEGNAVALAAGRYLATGSISLVYMQNSGLCNSINPLTSLMDEAVYKIPALLLIGWRGRPGEKDEPEHIKQGIVTEKLLDTLGIPHRILPDTAEEAANALDEAMAYMKARQTPYALIVKKGTFEPYQLKDIPETKYPLSRETAIETVSSALTERDIIVSTTGMASRELFEYRERSGRGHEADFLNIGAMGHCSSIAIGLAISKPSTDVYCLDGDGALIMHMGSLAVTGVQGLKNFKHIVINNGSHDSVGGQPTAGSFIDIPSVAKACLYKAVYRAQTRKEVINKMKLLKKCSGPALLEIKVHKGARKDLTRPDVGPIERKELFMRFLRDKK